ncbi:MAG: 5-oxoprolinase subunit PxpB [Proteobacteria bacterium]|nr:5-oxoprolinase subunit PxpB [Pseudomonadota bacterium]
MPTRLLDLGDAACTLEFGHTIAPALVARVAAAATALHEAQAQGALPGVTDVVPTLRSLTVCFDPLTTDRDALAALLLALDAAPAEAAPPTRRWRLPACYDAQLGADLAEVARALDASTDDVVRLHSGSDLRVAMLGFLPGFAFLTGLAPALHLPRRREPRLRVPPGSVAVAGGMSAVYPWASPGGWHLLGNCPLPLFNPALTPPSLLAPGDAVRFDPISPGEHAALLAAVARGEVDAQTYAEAP